MEAKYKIIFFTILVFLSISNMGTYIKKEIDSGKEDENEEQSRPTEVRKYTIENNQGIIIPDQQQSLRETQLLREEISGLKKELQEQKELIKTQSDTTSLLRIELQTGQRDILSDLRDANMLLQEFSSFTMTFINLQKQYKDAFIYGKDGKLFAYIDFPELKIYEYSTGNLLGWINSEKNEVVRNYDNSIIATVENDFLIDSTGSPIASIERSETQRWEREKLFSMTQKTPISHFFTAASDPQQFIQPRYRTSDWSTQKLEDILFFSEKNIQKLK